MHMQDNQNCENCKMKNDALFRLLNVRTQCPVLCALCKYNKKGRTIKIQPPEILLNNIINY